MVSLEDMRSIIQEWMAQANSNRKIEITQAKNEIYLQGRADQKHEDLDAQVILTKNEIKVLETSLIKKILAAIESEYDLDDEISAHPREFYNLVEGFYPTITPPTKDDNEISIYTPKSKDVADKILNEINVFDENNSLKEIDYKISLNDFEFYKNISKEKFDELDIHSKEHQTGNLLFIDYECFILDGFGYCKVGMKNADNSNL